MKLTKTINADQKHDIGGAHRGVAEDSRVLGCDDASLSKWSPSLWRIKVLPPSQVMPSAELSWPILGTEYAEATPYNHSTEHRSPRDGITSLKTWIPGKVIMSSDGNYTGGQWDTAVHTCLKDHCLKRLSHFSSVEGESCHTKLTNSSFCACCKWQWPTCIGYISESGNFATMFFSGSATLGQMPLWPFCCQLYSVLVPTEPWTRATTRFCCESVIQKPCKFCDRWTWISKGVLDSSQLCCSISQCYQDLSFKLRGYWFYTKEERW